MDEWINEWMNEWGALNPLQMLELVLLPENGYGILQGALSGFCVSIFLFLILC